MCFLCGEEDLLSDDLFYYVFNDLDIIFLMGFKKWS